MKKRYLFLILAVVLAGTFLFTRNRSSANNPVNPSDRNAASTPSSNPGKTKTSALSDKSLLSRFPIITQKDRPINKGTFERVKIVQTKGKYPLLRDEQVIAKTAGSENILKETVMAADHLTVKLDETANVKTFKTDLAKAGFHILKENSSRRTYLIGFKEVTPDAVPKAILKITQFKAVKYAEPDFVGFASATPNDPYFYYQWSLNNTAQYGGVSDADIDGPEAWNISKGSKNIKVGVIDSGVDYNHPDLAGNIWTNPREIPGNGIDDDGNGLVDDVHGWDFANDDNDPMDDFFHGTHCAGSIGAVSDNGYGIAGVCWNVSIIPIKFLGVDGFGYYSDAVDALYYAAKVGADLTSNSWGGTGYSQALKDAIDQTQRGKLLIAAAMNNSSNNDISPYFPASYNSNNIISVAATDPSDNLASFSNYGASSVDLGAPGQWIWSTMPLSTTAAMSQYGLHTNFDYLSGTSMATPHVAGVCALLMANNDALSAAQIKQIVLNSTDKIPSLRGKCVSGGRLNANNALNAAIPLGVAVTNTAIDDDQLNGTFGNGDNRINPGETIGIKFTIKNTSPQTIRGINGILFVSSADGSFNYQSSIVLYGDLASNASASGKTQHIIPIPLNLTTPTSLNCKLELSDSLNRKTAIRFNLAVSTIGTISGRVIDDVDHTPVLAKILYSGPTSGSANCDSNGNYSIPATDGEYTLQCVADNYLEGDLVKITIPPANVVQNFEITKKIIINAPDNLSAQSVTGKSVQLSWDDKSDNETGFIIERNQAGSIYLEIGNVGNNATSFTDTNLTPATQYTYRVKAVNGKNSSPYSNEATVITIVNIPPKVSILNPTSGSVYPVNDVIYATFSTEDVDGHVVKLKFLLNNVDYGETYSLNEPVPFYLDQLGQNTLTVIATDDLGAISQASVDFKVAKPVVTLSPTNIVLSVPKGSIAARQVKLSNVSEVVAQPTVESFNTTNPLWHRSKHRSHRGTESWYYGIEDQWNYDTGAANAGDLDTVQFQVPADGPSKLSFWYWREMEDIPDSNNDGQPDYIADVCNVWVNVYQQQDGRKIIGSWDLLTKLTSNTAGNWKRLEFDLSKYAGQTITLSFSFVSVDEVLNDFEGWYIDEVKFNNHTLGMGYLQTSAHSNPQYLPPGQKGVYSLTFDSRELDTGTYEEEVVISGTPVRTKLHVYDPNIFIDNFNRANSDSLGTKWTESFNSTLNIFSNKVVGIGLASPAFSPTEPIIQKIWFDHVTTSNSFGGLFVCGSSNSYYQGIIGTDPRNPKKLSYASIDKVDDSGVHNLASVSTPSRSGTMTLENTGSNLLMNFNGTRILSAPYTNSVSTNWTFGLISDGWKITAYKAAHEPLKLPFKDEFERSNRTDLSIHWSELMGNFTIVSNQVVCSTSNSVAVVNGIRVSDISIESKVDVTNPGSLGGLISRCDEKGSFYCAGLYNNNGAIIAAIGRCLNKDFTLLSQKPVNNPNAVVRLDTIGTKISLYVDDVLVDEITDSTISTPGSVGIAGAGGPKFDDFNVVNE